MLQLRGVYIDYTDLKRSYLPYREEQKILKNENDIKLIETIVKPLIEKFVKLHVDDSIRFPMLETIPNNPMLSDDYKLALKQVIKNEKNVDVDLDILPPLIYQEAKTQMLDIFKDSFLDLNQQIIGSKNSQDWIDAYINTFCENDNYDHTFQEMIIHAEIPIPYDSEEQRNATKEAAEMINISQEQITLITLLFIEREKRKTSKRNGCSYSSCG